MERFPTELIYVLIFLGIVVFQFFARRLQQRAQQAEEAASPEPPAAEELPLEDIWGRTPAPAEAPQPVAAPARPPAPPRVGSAPAAPRRLHPARALLNTPRDLRRAVVLAMVLGPCRAEDPPERDPL
jgi:hypothetical protein